MKNIAIYNKSGEKLLIKYKKLFGNLILDGPVYLEVISNKVTF